MTWKTAIEKQMKIHGIKRKADLARLSGVGKSYITEILHDDPSKRKTKLSFDVVEKIAAAFKMKGWALWKLAEQEK